MAEYTDTLLGRLIDKVDQLGIREETLIIFYSDNGTNMKVVSEMGDQVVHGGKGTPGDLGTRVPLLVSWKGTSGEGIINTDLVDSTDFLPTILEAGGVPEIAKRESMDGVSFLPQIHGQPGEPRSWVYVHQEARPGWDKDKFVLERFARDKRYKLYDDGRLIDVPEDLYEEHPIMPEMDPEPAADARQALQVVLDSMRPYPIYDPGVMPRPNIAMQLYQSYSFEDNTGYVVMEAETVPIPDDESWRFENAIPGFTGVGYVRALRDQLDKPERGFLSFDANISTTGDWTIQVRHRHDHASVKKQNGFWMKIDDAEWVAYRSAENDKPVDSFKIDRIVAFRSHRQGRAMAITTPQVRYHPWVNKYLK